MTYEIGVATRGAFAAVWTVDTPYIEVYWISEFRSNRKMITDAAKNCQAAGQSLHVINTGGDLDEFGRPKNFTTLDAYVQAELDLFVKEDGQAYIENARPAR